MTQRNLSEHGELVRLKILAVLRRTASIGINMSIREISQAVGLKSSSTVYNHLNILERQGKIKLLASRARSIQVIREPEEICTCCNGFGWTVPNEINRGRVYQEAPGTELIGDTRSPEETSFGH